MPQRIHTVKATVHCNRTGLIQAAVDSSPEVKKKKEFAIVKMRHCSLKQPMGTALSAASSLPSSFLSDSSKLIVAPAQPGLEPGSTAAAQIYSLGEYGISCLLRLAQGESLAPVLERSLLEQPEPSMLAGIRTDFQTSRSISKLSSVRATGTSPAPTKPLFHSISTHILGPTA